MSDKLSRQHDIDLIKSIGIEAYIRITKPENLEEWLGYRDMLNQYAIALQRDLAIVLHELNHMPGYWGVVKCTE